MMEFESLLADETARDGLRGNPDCSCPSYGIGQALSPEQDLRLSTGCFGSRVQREPKL